MAFLVNDNDSKMIDDIVIDSKWCEDTFEKAMVYHGSYLKTGSPRCDVLYGDRTIYHKAFCQKHGIPEESRILLFAPTFREGAKNGKRSVFSEVWTIDFGRMLGNLERRFGGSWYLCIRVHPQLAAAFAGYENEDLAGRLIDESQADDMYELMAGMDGYVTDYSSAAFEAGFAKIPVFLYADDIGQYTHDRGNMMWNFMEDELDHVTNNKEITPGYDVVLPFSIATDNDELERNILQFDEADYGAKMDALTEQIGLVFDGKASRRIADVIEKL
jgi:CDP-glycerol glycerophosphotransferase